MSDISIYTTDLKLCTENYFRQTFYKLYRKLGFESCLYCSRGLSILCDQCRQNYKYISPSCVVCGGLSLGSTIHKECRDSRGSYDFCLFLYRYTKNQKKLFADFKYSLAFSSLDVIRLYISDYFQKDPFLQILELRKKYKKIILVPVPSTNQKIKKRGFYPLRELAILFMREFLDAGIDIDMNWTLFSKREDGTSQAYKSKEERLLAVNNSYEINTQDLKGLLPKISDGTTALCILDDVYTTGATATVLIELLSNSLPIGVREKLSIGFVSYVKA